MYILIDCNNKQHHYWIKTMIIYPYYSAPVARLLPRVGTCLCRAIQSRHSLLVGICRYLVWLHIYIYIYISNPSRWLKRLVRAYVYRVQKSYNAYLSRDLICGVTSKQKEEEIDAIACPDPRTPSLSTKSPIASHFSPSPAEFECLQKLSRDTRDDSPEVLTTRDDMLHLDVRRGAPPERTGEVRGPKTDSLRWPRDGLNGIVLFRLCRLTKETGVSLFRVQN